MDLFGYFWCGSGPVLCCFAVLSDGETQIWPGDLRVVAGASFGVFGFLPFCVCFHDAPRLRSQRVSGPPLLLLLSLSGPSLRARSATTEEKLDDGWPESEKDVFQAALRMVIVKNSW